MKGRLKARDISAVFNFSVDARAGRKLFDVIVMIILSRGCILLHTEHCGDLHNLLSVCKNSTVRGSAFGKQ